MIGEVAVSDPGAQAAFDLLLSTSDDGDGTLLLIAGFAIGLFLIYHGFKKWQRKRLIEDTPTESVRSMAAGRTELAGVANGDNTIEAPFTDQRCLHTDWEIEEYRRDPDDDDYDWVTVASGSRSVPFYLDDGTGRVLVQADSGEATFDLSDERRTQFTTGSSESPPPEVREFIEQYDGDDADVNFLDNPIDTLTDLFGGNNIGYSNRRRRYTQTVLPDGTEVYVLGSAVPRSNPDGMEHQEDLLVMTREEGLDMLLISDMNEAELEAHYERWAPLEIIGGIALSAVCLALLLGAF